jgi:HTH-type transcriptional regulator/antitoxin HigA
MSARVPAEVFPPGEFVKEELEARGWTQNDLADILGRPPRLVSEIISGKRGITPETANGLGQAFGTGGQFWMNLDSSFQLARARRSDDVVARRAKLFEKAPIKELLRRNWIEASSAIDVLESRVCAFYGTKTLDEELEFPYAARGTVDAEVSRGRWAWLFRAKHLANSIAVPPYSSQNFDALVADLRGLLNTPEQVRTVPDVLARYGVRLVVVEPLPQTRIDGACFWLDERSPVVALSLRYDRIDWFWHTVMHELGHVKKGDAQRRVSIDVDLVGEQARRSEDKPKAERDADAFAVEALVPQARLQNFIDRVRPLYSKKKIYGFAATLGVHPGVVVGQLQHRDEISYAHSRELLVRVRDLLTESAVTDGWGHMVSQLSQPKGKR